jgi:hypothetical protein
MECYFEYKGKKFVTEQQAIEYIKAEKGLIEQTSKESGQNSPLSLDNTVENIREANTGNIKKGVLELFESNPELANEVYEALGFKTKSEIEVSNRILNPDMAPDGYSKIIALNGEPIGEFALLDIGNEVHLSGSLGARTEIDTKHRNKGYGYQAYVELAKQVKSEGKVLVSDTNMTEDAIRVWEKLVKEGYANKVKRLVEGFDNFEEEVYIIDNSKLSISEITPQQKQQAQQLYSQYLDTITDQPIVHKGFRNKAGYVHKTPNHTFYTNNYEIADKWYKDEQGIKSFAIPKVSVENFKGDTSVGVSVLRQQEENYINNSETDTICSE